jgi:hypothetical protein
VHCPYDLYHLQCVLFLWSICPSLQQFFTFCATYFLRVSNLNFELHKNLPKFLNSTIAVKLISFYTQFSRLYLPIYHSNVFIFVRDFRLSQRWSWCLRYAEYCATSKGNLLVTFRDIVSVSFQGSKFRRRIPDPWNGPTRFPETSVSTIHSHFPLHLCVFVHFSRLCNSFSSSLRRGHIPLPILDFKFQFPKSQSKPRYHSLIHIRQLCILPSFPHTSPTSQHEAIDTPLPSLTPSVLISLFISLHLAQISWHITLTFISSSLCQVYPTQFCLRFI